MDPPLGFSVFLFTEYSSILPPVNTVCTTAAYHPNFFFLLVASCAKIDA